MFFDCNWHFAGKLHACVGQVLYNLHVHNLTDELLVCMYLRLVTARSGIFLHLLWVALWSGYNYVSQDRVSTGRPKTTKTSLVQALDDLRTDGSGLDGVDFVG